jgi:hypothetical protein
VMDSLGKAVGFMVAQEVFFLTAQAFPSDAFPDVIPFLTFLQRRSRMDAFRGLLRGRTSMIASYLDAIEGAAKEGGFDAFGFKVLTHHLTRTKGLSAVLKDRGYDVVYLTRDIGWQVLSGLVAGQRGIYNTTSSDASDFTCTVDLAELERLILTERDLPELEINRLKDAGFKVLPVRYETFVSDRAAFFGQILDFLAIPPQSVPNTDYRVVIQNYEQQISNFGEALKVFDRLGVRT